MKTKFLFTLFFATFFVIHSIAQTKIDSLEQLLELKSGVDKLDVLLKLSKANWSISPKKGMQYADLASQLSDSLNDMQKKSKALMYGGVNAWFEGSYELSISYLQKSLKIADTIDDRTLKAYNLNNLGMVNSDLKNYDKAIDYYSKASELMLQLGDELEYAKIIHNIGDLSMKKGKPKDALKNYLSILEIAKNSKEQVFHLWLLLDIGSIYQDIENKKQAEFFFIKALEVSNSINDKVGKAIALGNLGKLFLQNNEYPKARKYLNESLELALKTGAKEEIKNGYKNLSNYYSAVSDSKTSLENYKLFKKYSDSIIDEKKQDKIVEMETRFETESKEKENDLLRSENEIKKLDVEKQTYFRNFFIALSIIAFLVILFVYYRFWQKKKLNNELNLKNELITKQKEEIKAQTEELLTTNEKLLELDKFKQEMTSMIVHDLKTPLNGIINISEKQPVLGLKLAKQSGKQMLNLVLNILDVQKYEETQLIIEPAKHSLPKLVQRAIDEVVFLADYKNINIVNQATYIEVESDKELTLRILINLLTNAIKYTPYNGKIKINSTLEDFGKCKISITDSGIGIPKEQLSSIFEKFSQVKAKKSGIVRSTGLGLTFCKIAVEAHDGDIGVESKEGEGSSFWFTLKTLKGTIQETQKITHKASPQNIQFVFSNSDKVLLKPYLETLQKLEVFETTDIEKVIETIDSNSEAIVLWKETMMKCLFSMDEKTYSRLVNI